MSIRHKLYLTYGVMAVFVALMVLGTTRFMENIGRDFEMITDQTVNAANRLQDMRAAGLQIVSSSAEMALLRAITGPEAPRNSRAHAANEITIEREQRATAVKALRTACAAYSALVDQYFPGETGFRDAIERSVNRLIFGSDALFTLMETGVPPQDVIASKESLEAVERDFLNHVRSSLAHHQTMYQTRERALRVEISKTQQLAWLGLALVIIAIALLGLIMTRRITEPLRELTKASERLGQGELLVRVASDSTDELGILGKAFNRMAESLKTNIAKREAAETRLHEAQKLKAVGQLTGGISHDFNNILAIIAGNAQLMREKGSQDFDKHIAAIDRASSRGSELTQRLLAFARRQPLAPRTVELPRLISEMEDMLRQSLGHGIDISTTWDPDLWPVQADPGQIENALLNLALNAKHAMSGTGAFTISCSNGRIDAEAAETDSELVPGDYVVIKVSDTGAGMPHDVLEQAFEPFFTTKEFGSGSGLGLSMVYGFARQSGGQVMLDSEEGVGTTVTLYLPKAELPAEAGGEPDALSQEPPKGRGERILVLEDEEQVLEMVTAMLDGLGYDVCGVSTVEEAKYALETERFELVLSDVVLGAGTNGPDFIAQARQDHPGLRAVFMSGYAAEPGAGGTMVSADEILINKPFHRGDLATTLKEALN